MEQPCETCVFSGGNPIRCDDCKRPEGVFHHYKLSTYVVNEIKEDSSKPVKKKKKSSKS